MLKILGFCQSVGIKENNGFLIDDCFPDGSGAICDRFAEADHRIRVIHKENQRVSAARNDGLALAKGEYVLWL